MRQIDGQMTLDMLMSPEPEPEPEIVVEEKHTPELAEFSDYVGKCEYCMWHGYGLYSTFTGKRKKGTEQYNCQWEMKRYGLEPWCIDKSYWKPNCKTIQKLCGNCEFSNSFHYQKKPEHKEHSREAFMDPVEEPNIYCTHYGGSVNRREVFRDFWEHGFGPCRWDRQHEWDTCDAWISDGWRLKGKRIWRYKNDEV